MPYRNRHCISDRKDLRFFRRTFRHEFRRRRHYLHKPRRAFCRNGGFIESAFRFDDGKNQIFANAVSATGKPDFLAVAFGYPQRIHRKDNRENRDRDA